jgi:hypothetical protein
MRRLVASPSLRHGPHPKKPRPRHHSETSRPAVGSGIGRREGQARSRSRFLGCGDYYCSQPASWITHGTGWRRQVLPTPGGPACLASLKNVIQSMKTAIRKSLKGGKRPGAGRPSTGQAPIMSLRMPLELTAAVEGWAARQPERPARSEAFRRLVELGLAASTSRRPTDPKAHARSAEMAHATLDRHADQTATPEEQASRKRRLMKGPKEFRDFRKDHK